MTKRHNVEIDDGPGERWAMVEDTGDRPLTGDEHVRNEDTGEVVTLAELAERIKARKRKG